MLFMGYDVNIKCDGNIMTLKKKIMLSIENNLKIKISININYIF